MHDQLSDFDLRVMIGVSLRQDCKDEVAQKSRSAGCVLDKLDAAVGCKAATLFAGVAHNASS